MAESKPKRLYRSTDNAMIAGVCAGLAEYFNTDPVWVRLLFLLLLVAAGSTLLAYIILWILMPEKPTKN